MPGRTSGIFSGVLLFCPFHCAFVYRTNILIVLTKTFVLCIMLSAHLPGARWVLRRRVPCTAPFVFSFLFLIPKLSFPFANSDNFSPFPSVGCAFPVVYSSCHN